MAFVKCKFLCDLRIVGGNSTGTITTAGLRRCVLRRDEFVPENSYADYIITESDIRKKQRMAYFDAHNGGWIHFILTRLGVPVETCVGIWARIWESYRAQLMLNSKKDSGSGQSKSSDVCEYMESLLFLEEGRPKRTTVSSIPNLDEADERKEEGETCRKRKKTPPWKTPSESINDMIGSCCTSLLETLSSRKYAAESLQKVLRRTIGDTLDNIKDEEIMKLWRGLLYHQLSRMEAGLPPENM